MDISTYFRIKEVEHAKVCLTNQMCRLSLVGNLLFIKFIYLSIYTWVMSTGFTDILLIVLVVFEKLKFSLIKILLTQRGH